MPTCIAPHVLHIFWQTCSSSFLLSLHNSPSICRLLGQPHSVFKAFTQCMQYICVTICQSVRSTLSWQMGSLTCAYILGACCTLGGGSGAKGSNLGSSDYKSDALPLSYSPWYAIDLWCHTISACWKHLKFTRKPFPWLKTLNEMEKLKCFNPEINKKLCGNREWFKRLQVI